MNTIKLKDEWGPAATAAGIISRLEGYGTQVQKSVFECPNLAKEKFLKFESSMERSMWPRKASATTRYAVTAYIAYLFRDLTNSPGDKNIPRYECICMEIYTPKPVWINFPGKRQIFHTILDSCINFKALLTGRGCVEIVCQYPE